MSCQVELPPLPSIAFPWGAFEEVLSPYVDKLDSLLSGIPDLLPYNVSLASIATALAPYIEGA